MNGGSVVRANSPHTGHWKSPNISSVTGAVGCPTKYSPPGMRGSSTTGTGVAVGDTVGTVVGAVVGAGTDCGSTFGAAHPNRTRTASALTQRMTRRRLPVRVWTKEVSWNAARTHRG